MNRKKFLVQTGKLSVCCGALLTVDCKSAANHEPHEKDNEARRAIGSWVTNLLDELDKNLSEENKKVILETCGRECARRGFKKVALKYKGDLTGFISAIHPKFFDSVEFNEFDGVVRIYGKKDSSCVCPIVRNTTAISESICMCSQGWYREIFETVTGRPAWTEPVKTVVRGDDRCVHAIYLS